MNRPIRARPPLGSPGGQLRLRLSSAGRPCACLSAPARPPPVCQLSASCVRRKLNWAPASPVLSPDRRHPPIGRVRRGQFNWAACVRPERPNCMRAGRLGGAGRPAGLQAGRPARLQLGRARLGARLFTLCLPQALRLQVDHLAGRLAAALTARPPAGRAWRAREARAPSGLRALIAYAVVARRPRLAKSVFERPPTASRRVFCFRLEVGAHDGRARRSPKGRKRAARAEPA